MWELDHKEGWAPKNWYFQIMALEKTPESPLITRRSNQLILKEVNTEYSLEGLILKLQYFGHLMWRANSLEKPLMLGKIEGKRRRRWQRMRCLDSITDSMAWTWANSRRWGGQGSLVCCSPWSQKRHASATEQQVKVWRKSSLSWII